MKKVLIIMAPFGFGPAAKGLYVAESLANRAQLTLVTTGDAYTFVNDFSPEGVRCLDGRIYDLFTTEGLAEFDLIISIHNVPAINALCALGFSSRLVFIDSLLPWRVGRDEVKTQEPILAYLVQDFPGTAEHLDRCHAETVELVAPIVGAQDTLTNRPTPRQGVTMCLGGLTSPVISWQCIRDPIEALLEAAYEVCSQHNLYLTVIGNDALCEFSIGTPEHMKIVGAVSPHQSRALIARSEFILTTPGIGTTYEAMLSDTPMLLLPPTNSTQLHQFKVFADHDIGHVLEGSPVLVDLPNANQEPWQQHGKYCGDWSHLHHNQVASSIAESISSIKSSHGDEKIMHLLKQQGEFVQGLSHINVTKPLLELIQL